jgi:hypothetical protein
MITNCGIDYFIRKDCGQHIVNNIDRVNLIRTRLIPDIMRWCITGVVYKINLFKIDR